MSIGCDLDGIDSFMIECYRVSTMDKARCIPDDDDKYMVDLRPVEGEEADEELAVLARAVGHPARVKILRLLGRRKTCVCGEIVDFLPLAQSTVSQHLRVLKDAGLIRGVIDGPRVCYCLDLGAMRRLKALIGAL